MKAENTDFDCSYLLAGWRQLVRVLSQYSEVVNNGLQMRHLSQHGDFDVLKKGEQGGLNLTLCTRTDKKVSAILIFFFFLTVILFIF